MKQRFLVTLKTGQSTTDAARHIADRLEDHRREVLDAGGTPEFEFVEVAHVLPLLSIEEGDDDA